MVLCSIDRKVVSCGCCCNSFLSTTHYAQLASIVLKQYIESHWSALNEKFEEPELTERVCASDMVRFGVMSDHITVLQSKVEIKEMLPACLGDSHSKVRAAVVMQCSCAVLSA